MNERARQLELWMLARENEHLEFKEAKQDYDFEELVKYCVALANEGGGRLILGITDKLPRRVVGSQAFGNIEKAKASLIDRVQLRVDVEEINHPDGRVLVFHIPSRPIGMSFDKVFSHSTRSCGGSLISEMTDNTFRMVFSFGIFSPSTKVLSGRRSLMP
jgi:ATP-dependent DNA helicase RecG